MRSNHGRQPDARTIVELFGVGSTAARAGVGAICESLDDAARDAVGTDRTSPQQEQAAGRLARWLGLGEKRLSPARLRAALETYYAAVVRLVVGDVLGDEAKSVVADGVLLSLRDTDDSPIELRDMATSLAENRRCHPGCDAKDTGRSGEAVEAVDWFGPLYQDLFPRSMRHALGEYYTPEWLAEHVLDVVKYPAFDGNEHWQDASGTPSSARGWRLLDPTCGSGVFLLAAIGRIREAAGAKVAPDRLARRILEGVAGYDVNPLAVLTARANFLLAIRDLLPEGLPCPAPPIFARDVILDSPGEEQPFDYVVGNPPWVAWDDLPAEYRDRTKPLWQQYGLFSLSATQARHGGGKKDLSMLVLYRTADRYLRHGGRLGFVITQTLFQTKGAGDGFRRFRLGEDGEPLGVYRVDDLTAARPFAGAANWTATVALEKGRPTSYPVEYVRWQDASRSVACVARPIDAAHPRSPWIVLPRGLTRNLAKLTGPSDYTANLGANSGGANGVYWVELIGPPNEHVHASVDMAPGPGVVIRNLAGVGKRSAEQVEMSVEPELLYPLVRWSDLRRWRAVPSGYLLLAQDVETRSGIDEATMRRRWPEALAYLARFRELLERRAAYRRYQSAGPYWSMYNVGPYTLASIKVVWRRMDQRINAAVVEPVDDPVLGRRPVVVQETCVQVAVESSDEAHYLAALLNSAPANFLVTAHSVRGGKGFGTPSMLDYLNVRRFDPNDPRHGCLAELSREAHRMAEGGLDGHEVQRDVDRLAAALWGVESTAIEACIEEA